MNHTVIPVDTFDYFVFGATGDLSKKKLLPALYHRFADGQIPATARIIGCARASLDSQQFKLFVKDALNEHLTHEQQNQTSISDFLNLLHYQSIDVTSEGHWQALVNKVNETDDGRITIFYLSVGPSLFAPIVNGLKTYGLNKHARLVVEKPLGFDLNSASSLNRLLRNAFDEKRIYRIDHYLGKETVQNLMALRFANAMFEPLWNARHIDHVQITAAENLGVKGRGDYYDNSGAMRDMVQNHLMQLLCLCAMEPPANFEADSVRDEKLKVLKSLQPLVGQQAVENTARGQYSAAHKQSSYLEDINKTQSYTESYTALCVNINNWRWAGTPFYLRTGKCLAKQMMEITFIFRKTPHSIFGESADPLQPNCLVIRLQPDEGIDIEVTTKKPGHGGMHLHQTVLETTSKVNEHPHTPDAYQRLLLDVIRGDQTLFMRGDEVEAAWKWVDPIISSWQSNPLPVEEYSAASQGPDGADVLIKKGGRKWRTIQ